jgi:cytochrome c oxidase assembly factor CtaG
VGIELDIPALVLIAVATALYVRAVVVLRRRGYDVPFWQQVSWHGGMTLTAAALLGPLDHLAEDLVSAHMAQHLLIADLAAPFLLVGLRTPVLVFLLPRPVLVPLARRRTLRRLFRFLRRPLVALPLFALVLYGWHIGFLFEGALESEWLHTLQHESFVVASLLVWWAAIEPKRRRLPGELWKAGYILGTRVVSMFLGMAFLVARTPFYAGFYGDRAREHGLSPLEDQQIAGGLMMGLDILIMLFALAFFFWRAAEDHDRRAAEERRAAVT